MQYRYIFFNNFLLSYISSFKPKKMKTTFVIVIVFCITLINIKISFADFPWAANVKVSVNGGDEPTIAVKYPHIYISFIANPQKFRASTDGGLSWLPEVSFPQGTCCDGSMYVDEIGFLHISTIYLYNKVAYYRSTDYGTSWTAPFIISANPQPPYSDKNWTFNVKNRIYVVWQGFNQPTGDFRILLSKSTDRGLTFSPQVQVNDGSLNGYRQWPVVREDPKDSNIVYVSMNWDKRNFTYNYRPPWQIFIAKSTNGGTTFLPNTALPDTGRSSILIGNNPYSLTSSIAVSPVYNDVYAVWVDSTPVFNGKLNVYFSRSTNGALSFEPRKKIPAIPDPDTSYHFKPWIECDPYGTIHLIWYDTRGFSSNQNGSRKATYYTYSINRGVTWAPEERISDTTDAFSLGLFGHYQTFTTDSFRVYSAWGDLRQGLYNVNVYYSWRPLPVISGNITYSEIPQKYELRQNYPNPFNPVTTISYELPVQGSVKINVFNVLGGLVKTLVKGIQKPGKYSVNWDASHNASGIYFYKLETENYSETKKMILIK